jgi:penicillin amidase
LRFRSRARLALSLPLALLALAIAAPLATAAPAPYGSNDAGGFRNVLPPGENGTASFNEILAFRGPGLLPPHFADQQPLYENLLYAAPTLTEGQIPSYFKDATFGVPAGEVESEIEPRPGATIVRDKAFGVPHVYGVTRADTMFGAGYAGAADRLFLMDVLRHTGRAELASFLGGSNAGADASQWQFAPTPKPTSNGSWRRRPSSTALSGSRRSTTSTPTSKGSTPTSPPPGSIPR